MGILEICAYGDRMIPIRLAHLARKRAIRATVLAPAVMLLGACNAVVLDPSGDVAMQQRDLLIASTLLMLLIIVPVMVLTAVVAWRYRESNTEATYLPDWDHSTALELVIWSAPLLIIIALGAITWLGSHTLDPYRPIARLDNSRPLDAKAQPLEVDVVAMDWKWLFFYPQYGIATINQLALPVDRPVDFKITSTSMMNSFFVPALAGQVYAMPGMETQLHAVINKPGKFTGFSANYSGEGFAGMHFNAYGFAPDQFDRWVNDVRGSQLQLTNANYLKLAAPSENVPPMGFASFAPGLFQRILNLCTHPGDQCIANVMQADMMKDGGGMGAAPERVNDTGADNSRQTKGALFKSPQEKGEGKNIGEPPAPGAPGVNKPGDQKNRGMS
jgi:cytochrome o ubiquinol oxidase subunit 2